MSNIQVDTLIIGGGVAGLSAAIYTSREGFSTVILTGFEPSAISLTSSIENYPGFETAPGDELLEALQTQAEEFGLQDYSYAAAVKVDTSNPEFVAVTAGNGKVYEARSVLIATGAVARLLGLEGEREFLGRGVSTCATCDGAFFRDREVLVVGGGDTAIEDTLFLANTFNTKVELLVRGDGFRTNSPDSRKLLALDKDINSNVNIHFNTSIESLDYVQGGVRNVKTNKGELKDADGIFVAIGRDPATGFLAESTVPLTSELYVQTEPGSTKVPGDANKRIWAAGDVVDNRYSQAITGAGDAVKAAMEIRSFLNSEGD